MRKFFWHRRADGPHGAVRWELWSQYSADRVGSCFYLPGSKRYRCSASARHGDGAVLTEYYAGTAAAARAALERDWHKRSIGLFGEDEISFEKKNHA